MFDTNAQSLLASVGIYAPVNPAHDKPQAKTLAKSLHTVTVLAQVAKHLRQARTMTVLESVLEAAEILGLGEMTDTYGLIGQAIKKLSK